MAKKVSVVIEKDATGYFASCPEVTGCAAHGESFDDVINNIKEAIELYLENLTAEETQNRLSRP